MQLNTRTLVTALALTTLTFAATPCVAADVSRSDEPKTPVIRVVIDRENQLALIPEGTILPAGFQIISPASPSGDGLESAARITVEGRPLVFAYAAADRFVGVEPLAKGGAEPGEIVDVVDAFVLEPKAVSTSNPCPAVIVVQVGPDIIHELNCDYEPRAGLGPFFEYFTPSLFYPETAVKVTFSRGLDYAPPLTDVIRPVTCPVPGHECTPGWVAVGLTGPPNAYYVSKAFVRLPGVCTQDPPYCPTFSSTISLPVLAP